jgi:hypothetical protein
VLDHQYDIILPTVLKINQRTVAEARRNRADRIKRETGQVVDPVRIPNTDLVFRITCWEHIPMAPKKIPKSATKKKRIDEIFELELEPEDPLAELIEVHIRDDILEMNGLNPSWTRQNAGRRNLDHVAGEVVISTEE